MASVYYNSRERRLVFESLCWPDDAPGLAEAIVGFAEGTPFLTLDLTRMVLVPQEVATAIGEACHRAETAGCRLQVWTPGHAPTAARITAARAAASAPAVLEATA